ncbi:MAG: hypothetical protein EZS28_012663 [Streblomastix strix]|uniref:Uncharacterized protein n=1 Tax=Streblomastix strix TaxID=222440 RepID=A0A5J4WA59_9EUKA|nr:MAG: hypothetical protein EZS28_012663 [Streblomastix strix]
MSDVQGCRTEQSGEAIITHYEEEEEEYQDGYKVNKEERDAYLNEDITVYSELDIYIRDVLIGENDSELNGVYQDDDEEY